MGQFPQDGENGQNVAFCSFFWSSTVTKRFDFFLLRCYCREPDYHLGDYPYNVHSNLKWNTKSHGRQQCWIVLMQLCMKYADVLADQYIAGGYATHTGQHVGTASNLWKGKWFNLNRPGLISFNGKRGNDKDWPIPRAFQLPGGNIGIPGLIFGLQISSDSSLWSAFFAAVFSNMDI